MTQSVEGFVAVPQNVAGGQNVRQLQFQIAQPGGAYQTVLVEVVALCDSDTGLPLTPPTREQGDDLVELLSKILDSSEEARTGVLQIQGAVDGTPFPQHVSDQVSAQTQTTVGTTSGVVLVANEYRKRLIIQNTGIYPVYLGLGAAPTTTNYHLALAGCSNSAGDGSGGVYLDEMWKGPVFAISSTAGATVNPTELL
jgi:hypothetical protein